MSIKFIQAQSFQIIASGASAGDTTLALQSFKQIDGVTLLSATSLGDQCYGTLEPNNGTQEESIQFTGVIQNANGTATLTGVSSVGFISPYTVTSGLSKSHAGGSTFILSNDAGFYGNIITYINTGLSSGAAFASDTVAGITKLSVTPATGSNPIALGANDTRIPTNAQINYINSITQTGIPYAVATGTASAYTATLASAVTTLASGTDINVLIPTTNASGATINVNSLGAKNIKKNATTTLASGDLIGGQIATMTYDGTSFQLTSPPATAFTNITTGTTSHVMNSTSTQNIPHSLGAIPRMVRLTGYWTSSTIISQAVATYANGVQSSISEAIDNGTGANSNLSSAAFYIFQTNSGSVFGSAAITCDATNIILTWTTNGGPGANTILLLWEAYA